MKVLSVNIGEKRTVKWNNRVYETGIYKYPVETSIFLGIEDVENDHVIDRKVHGGVKKAVYAYGKNHYAYWQNLYPDIEFHHGIFGENLTVDNLDEEKIFVGDVYKLGEAIIEVTKPREPCVKLGIRFNDSKMVKQFWNTSKSGVYFKILQTGHVTKEDKFILLKKAENTLSIAEVYKTKKAKNKDQSST
ncbi:MAG: MOSC domain-containing protein [Flavobacteriia bacterium]|nr:MAG: MOSC domain-containing protein [Flavobacteriia bacterium]